MSSRRRYFIDLLKGVGIGSFVAGLVKFEFDKPKHKLMALTLVGIAITLWVVGYFVTEED